MTDQFVSIIIPADMMKRKQQLHFFYTLIFPSRQISDLIVANPE